MEITQDYTYFIFIFARIIGCIAFSQIFARGNVPKVFYMGFALVLTIFVYGNLSFENNLQIDFVLEYALLLLKELFIGFIIGHIVKLFMTVMTIGGDILDLEIGLSMAKIYDPKMQISMGISSRIFNLMMMFLFFSVGGHITLLKLFISTFEIIPLGNFTIGNNIIYNCVDLLSNITIYSVKMVIPVIAIEFIVEIAMGIMMKAIPQIHLFVVNIPVKLFIGLVSITIMAPSFASFLEKIITFMFDAIKSNLSLLM